MPLLKALFTEIIRKGALIVIGPDGGSAQIGCGLPSVVIRITHFRVIPRIIANPDLAIGEAYMDGTLVVENGDIRDFLDLCFANLGWSSGTWVRRARGVVNRLSRRIAQHNLIPRARERGASLRSIG